MENVDKEMSADKSAENSPNILQIFGPICRLELKSLRCS